MTATRLSVLVDVVRTELSCIECTASGYTHRDLVFLFTREIIANADECVVCLIHEMSQDAGVRSFIDRKYAHLESINNTVIGLREQYFFVLSTITFEIVTDAKAFRTFIVVEQTNCLCNMVLGYIANRADESRTECIQVEHVRERLLESGNLSIIVHYISSSDVTNMTRIRFTREEVLPGESTCANPITTNARGCPQNKVLLESLDCILVMIDPDQLRSVGDHPVLRKREIDHNDAIEGRHTRNIVSVCPADKLGIRESSESHRGGSIAVPINAVINNTGLHSYVILRNFKTLTLPRSLVKSKSISHWRGVGVVLHDTSSSLSIYTNLPCINN